MSRNLKIEQADLKYAPQKAELTHKCRRSTALIYVVIFYSFSPLLSTMTQDCNRS